MSAVNHAANILGRTENHTALIHCNLYQIALLVELETQLRVWSNAYTAETTEPDSSTYATRSFNRNSTRNRRSAGRVGSIDGDRFVIRRCQNTHDGCGRSLWNNRVRTYFGESGPDIQLSNGQSQD